VPHFDQFEAIGGTIHVRRYDDFAATLARLLTDEAAREALARQRADVLARYTRFDGRAAERIAGLIAAAIGAPTLAPCVQTEPAVSTGEAPV
jgi:hypothetical protein